MKGGLATGRPFLLRLCGTLRLERDDIIWNRHCEKRSDEAIQSSPAQPWIAALRSQ